ncbi:MAG: hypothetical protein R2764_02605 [Bacteroidales bacterium]
MKPFVFLLLILFSVNLSAQITRDEAVDIVISEIIAPDSVWYHHLYSRYEKMYFNDTLWLDGLWDYHLCPFEESWVFFIDDEPIVFWAHPCRIVFMNVSNSEYEIIEEEWPPHPFLIEHENFMMQWEWILGTTINPEQIKVNLRLHVLNPFRNQLKIDPDYNLGESIQYQLNDSEGSIVNPDL